MLEKFDALAYCFFSGVIGVTGCEPPVDFGPGVTPALFSSSCEALELLAVEPVFGLAPVVGPLPASFVDTAPAVGPLPASPFDCANAGADRPSAMRAVSKLLLSEDMATSVGESSEVNPIGRAKVPRPHCGAETAGGLARAYREIGLRVRDQETPNDCVTFSGPILQNKSRTIDRFHPGGSAGPLYVPGCRGLGTCVLQV